MKAQRKDRVFIFIILTIFCFLPYQTFGCTIFYTVEPFVTFRSDIIFEKPVELINSISIGFNLEL